MGCSSCHAISISYCLDNYEWSGCRVCVTGRVSCPCCCVTEVPGVRVPGSSTAGRGGECDGAVCYYRSWTDGEVCGEGERADHDTSGLCLSICCRGCRVSSSNADADGSLHTVNRAET